MLCVETPLYSTISVARARETHILSCVDKRHHNYIRHIYTPLHPSACHKAYLGWPDVLREPRLCCLSKHHYEWSNLCTRAFSISKDFKETKPLVFQISPLDHGEGNDQFWRNVSVSSFLNPKKLFLDFGMFLKEIVWIFECFQMWDTLMDLLRLH